MLAAITHLVERVRRAWCGMAFPFEDTLWHAWHIPGDPPVLTARDYLLKDPKGALRLLLQKCHDRRILLLLQFSWHHTEASVLTAFVQWSKVMMRQLPQVRLVVLAGTERERDLVREAGLRVEWINNNIFVDEAVFCPLEGVEKRHDAVYDARLVRFKRHHLAAGVARLGLITFPSPADWDEGYARQVRREFDGAHWFNDLYAPGYRQLTKPEVNAAINECRVGLCLSAEEGNMLASMQYLLAGLPIVTTPSIGGREVFFDPEFVLTVEPSAGAVAEGVREMIGRRIDPRRVRARVLEKVWSHRRRFLALVDDLRGKAGDENPGSEVGRWRALREANSRHWTAGEMLEKLGG